MKEEKLNKKVASNKTKQKTDRKPTYQLVEERGVGQNKRQTFAIGKDFFVHKLCLEKHFNAYPF